MLANIERADDNVDDGDGFVNVEQQQIRPSVDVDGGASAGNDIEAEYPRSTKMSQTLVFSSKESRNRFRRNSSGNGGSSVGQMIRMGQGQIGNMEKQQRNSAASGGTIGSLQQLMGTQNSGGGGGRNRSQTAKRSADHHQLIDGCGNKEFSSYFYNTNKFNSTEWLNLTSISGKNLDASAVAQIQINLPEDMRISKLLRRLCGEKNPVAAKGLCEKLKIVIVDANNNLYIRRSFDILADSIVTILKDGPEECLQDVSKIFGMMGYVVRSEFFIYKGWIVKSYKNPQLRVPMMEALLQTLRMDQLSRDLKEHAGKLMEILKDYLENAEIAKLFIAITNVIKQFSFNYPKAFENHFTDIVDIVVGWHLETDQSAELKQHCSDLLQSFNPFWALDMEFTSNLLGQFLEDIIVCGDEIRSNQGRLSPILDKTAPPELCFASLVGAYNSVLKCSWDQRAEFIETIGGSLLAESFEKITIFAVISLQSRISVDIVTPVNELIDIILDCYQFGVDIQFDRLFALIHLELEQLNTYTDCQILSLLFAILKIITELKTGIPFDFIGAVFDRQSNIRRLKFAKNKSIRMALIRIYQEILNVKNVSLLQEAYRHILIDLGIAMMELCKDKAIVTNSTDMLKWPIELENTQMESYTVEQAECTISFYLTSLSALATSNSSIIAMWALQPSILELLTGTLQTDNFKIWSNYRGIHYAILHVIASHCRNNHNFISSSNLINSQTTKITDVFNKLSLQESTTTATSPTSQHYAMILKFLQRILVPELGSEQMDLCLDWTYQLIQQSAIYSPILKSEYDFTNIIKQIAVISTQANAQVVQKCADIFAQLIDYDQLNTDVLTSMAEIACIHMCSNDHSIRDKFSCIFSKLPLDVALKQGNQYTGLAKERDRVVSHFQHWHISQTTFGDMRPQYFKEFIDKISVNNTAEHIETFLKNIFVNCWYQEHGAAGEFYKMVMKDVRCLTSWAQWEAAQYCVNNKLRTSLGKPQDTFLKIESIIKEDARILALKEKTNVDNVESLISNQKHARVLLGFMENLEKAIYNASQGTAFALPAPEKPAKTFFHINAPTCNEWFNRIRTAVDLVALHCMEPEMVIRYCEVVLKSLASMGKTNEPLFEHTLMSHAWALLRNGESEALHGLYVWTKSLTNRKFVWVKLAAEQAAGHREAAIAGYKSILESPDEPKLDRHVRDFIADQLTFCYLFQQRWNDLYELILSEEKRSTPRVTIPLLSVTSEQLANTIEFCETLDKSVLNMGDWETLDSTAPSVSSDFSMHKLTSLAENTVWKAGLSSEYECHPLKMGFSIVQMGLQECLRTKSREHLNNLILVNHIFHKTVELKIQNKNVNLRSLVVDKSFGSTTLLRLLCWSEFLLPDCDKENEQICINLRLDVCSVARKEGNLQICRTELENFFRKNGFAKQLGLAEPFRIDDVCEKLMAPAVAMDATLWNSNVARGVYETSKFLYCHPESKERAIQLAASTAVGISLKISNSNDDPDNGSMRQRVARSLLTLSEWVQGENEKLLTADLSFPLTQLVTSLPDFNLGHEMCPAAVPIVDTAVGKIIQYSTMQCPNLAKAWGALGNWCYRWGRKMVELRIEHSEKAGLRSNDIAMISKVIPDASAEDISGIVAILNCQSPEDEDIGVSEACSTEIIESKLKILPILQNSTQDQLHSIIEIWRLAHKAVYSYYGLSADAYFKYLQLATTVDDSLENDKNRNCSIVTATLRLLRLIVKHAVGLQDVLDEGLSTTPTSPWKVIIPQLFSRLNHHEPYVRKRVSELLCRVARDAPHLIIFPAVVGADQERSMNIADISMVTEDLDIEDDDKNYSNTNLISCFNSLLDTLSKQAPETVQQVQLLVRELKRITLLWDELWLVALTQVYSECSKRLMNFEMELHKVSNKDVCGEKNGFLIEKHRILMRPVLFVMERLHAITSEKPETHNEQMFQERYLSIIEDTIAVIKKPLDRENPNEAWQKFKIFYGLLQQRAQKRSSCTLKMTDISPVLANMKSTAISMPGVEHTDNQSELIYIKSVDNVVHILPTKTKPKKLAFHGSNGKRFTYLFKGLEDLHLDERIMQFLSISNSMMTRSTDCNGNISNYRARHYSVIPLGPRSGLISWVDGLTPIFALYKKWQQRDAANPKKEKGTPTAVTRPSDLFLNKLTPLLAEHNLKITDNRKDWPVSVLKQVLAELSSETPRDLLAKELWCYSTNAAQWRQVIRNYSQSIAVMSVIGYVIGLGDRHLDNILIELTSGEVVHIDYNVCFEKGKTLRVPEKVPFRMTPNLEEALGVTGIEGTFRLACEHVLKALKKGRETLLTLLEAFVYDPLVDWAIGEDGAGALAVSAYGGEALGGELRQARRQLEQEVTRDTLAIRFSEIKTEWMQNKEHIYQQLNEMRDYLQLLLKQRIELQQLDINRELLSKQLAMIREAESLGTALGSHQLNSLSQRYSVYKRTKNEFEQTRQLLTTKSTDCHQQIVAYLNCIDAIKTGNLIQSLKDIDEFTKSNHLSEFILVKEFLENSAQGGTFVQSDQTRKELDSSLLQQAGVMKRLIESLIQYGNVVKFHPRGYIDQHRQSKYAEWYRYLSENQSVQGCRDVVIQFHGCFGDNTAKQSLQQIMTFACQLQALLNENNFKLQRTYDRLNVEIDRKDDYLMKLERTYDDAKYAVDLFLREENGAIKALECVTLTALCDLNKRLLMIENAAASSGDNLLDLTLNGKWFLDELFVITSISNELTDLVYTHSSFEPEFIGAMECFQASSNLYICLRNMYHQFVDTILAETLHGIVSEEPTILQMISSISNFQEGLPPIPELLKNLHLHLRFTVLNMPSPHTNVSQDVRELRNKFAAMRMEFESNPSLMSAGKNLFLMFDRMFEDLELHQRKLVEKINSMKYPDEWKKIDQIKESKDLASLIFNSTTRSIFEDIYTVRRLETMIELFTMCLQVACAYKGNGVCPVYDDELLARPLKKFISDYIWRLQLGVASHSMSLILCGLLQKLDLNIECEINFVDVGAMSNVSLEDLCRKGVDRSIKRGEFSSIALNHATTLCLNLDSSWRKKELISYLQNAALSQSESLQRCQLLFSSHLWMFEEVLTEQSGFMITAPINRAALFMQLSADVKTLTAWRASLSKMRDEIATFVQAVTQRLKWAVGANPALQDLLASFSNVVNLKRTEFEKMNKMSETLLIHCNAILKYEALRFSTPESLEQDQQFLDLVAQWEKSCAMILSCSSVITRAEEALVELLDPEGPIDHIWLSNVASLIDDMTDQIQNDINQAEKRIVMSQDNLHNSAHRLRTLMGKHHRMGADVRSLLRSTLKIEGAHIGPIKDYLKRYKEFLERISELHGNVLSKDFTDEIVDGTLQHIAKVLLQINGIFDDLFLFEREFKDVPLTGTEEKPAENMPISPTLRKNKKGTEQKRNAYAVSVWRRIRMKLEGRDPDPTRRCTVQEQVDWMIREAMNPDNLAVLYEGWTPWV